jgi:phosphoribosylanthranilate isomerase
MKIKVCGMRYPHNITEISEIYPDFIGFIFCDRSKRFVGDDPNEQIFKNVPASVEKVGVFVDEEPGKIIETAHRYRIGTVQLHGSETSEYCSTVRTSGLKIIKSFGIGRNFNFASLTPYLDVCDFFLFDTLTAGYGGSGQKFNWEILSQYDHDKRFFLSGGIGPEDAGELKTFNHQQIYCIDINSRFETAPGLKSQEMIKKFINEVNGVRDELQC